MKRLNVPIDMFSAADMYLSIQFNVSIKGKYKGLSTQGDYMDLNYTFRNDLVFKMLFATHYDLLKSMVSDLLNIPLDDIQRFSITNPEIHFNSDNDKYNGLNVGLVIKNEPVKLELRVVDKYGCIDDSLFYWAQSFSTTFYKVDYPNLSGTIRISVVPYNLFEGDDYHSIYYSDHVKLDVQKHTGQIDIINFHYFELSKLPIIINPSNLTECWLALFKADTVEEIVDLESLGIPIINRVIKAYRRTIRKPEFKKMERLLSNQCNINYEEIKNLNQPDTMYVE